MRRQAVENFRHYEPKIQSHANGECRIIARRPVRVPGMIVMVCHRPAKLWNLISRQQDHLPFHTLAAGALVVTS
jgi:hypothetical protein